MTFKRRMRANNVRLANTDMPAETKMHGNMSESELLCVRVTKIDVIRQYMPSELSRLSSFFYCSRHLPSHNYCPGQKIIIVDCCGHNLVKGKLKS